MFARQVVLVMAEGLPIAIISFGVAYIFWRAYTQTAPTLSVVIAAFSASVAAYSIAAPFFSESQLDFSSRLLGWFVPLTVFLVSCSMFYALRNIHTQALEKQSPESETAKLTDLDFAATNAASTQPPKPAKRSREFSDFGKHWPKWVIAVILLTTYLFRYDIVSSSKGGEGGFAPAYVLDRWTGGVTVHVGNTYWPTKPVVK